MLIFFSIHNASKAKMKWTVNAYDAGETSGHRSSLPITQQATQEIINQ